MFVLLIYLCGVFAALVGLFLAARSDFLSFTIPNFYSVLLAVSFVLSYAAVSLGAPELDIFAPLRSHLYAFGGVLFITVLMYATKLLGAGDSKFMAAVGLWVGLTGLVPFLFYMSLAGGFLAGATLYMKKKAVWANAPEGSWPQVSQNGGQKLPYGLAISFGAFMAFLMNGYLNPAHWIALVQS